MSSRPNPWDPAFRVNNNRSMTDSQPVANSLSALPVGPQAPPAVPARTPAPSLNAPSLPLSSGFGNMLGMPGYGSYGSYGYGGGYSSFGGLPSFSRGLPAVGSDGGQNLTQLVESQLRPGFDSIYSVVQAFSSVSVMLESTYFALQNTVRAAVGMADHFQRIGANLRQLLLAAPVLAPLFRLLRRLLAWLGILRANPQRVWEALEKKRVEQAKDRGGGPAWPMLLFLSVAVGGPMLIWGLLRSLVRVQAERTSQWTNGQAEHYVAKALFDFNASREDELAFKAGDSIRVAPKNQQPNISGWLLASQAGRVGLVPANHVNVLGRMLPSGQLQAETTDAQKDSPVTDSEVKVALDT